MSFAALGVVFGDVGTSPLYALRSCFADVAGVTVNLPNVLGVLSLIFWSLALIITVKYVLIMLRADNRGEGGVLALTTLVLSECSRWSATRLAALGLIGCALFYGDGVITPAISVLSAIEGLEIAAPSLQRAVIPLSLIALLVLFAFQRNGTSRIGRVFGPVMVVWFATLAVLGVRAILLNPVVLYAANPLYAAQFLAAHSTVALSILATVFLCVTGGEALYADLGHFGRAPIARAWFYFVWPALLLNYFGQGALLLSNPAALTNPFYLLAPPELLVPLVILATFATVIASQAVISGVFSITQQCQQLGVLPRLRTVHSSAETMGQVYVPAINWLLCVATLGLVLAFRSSDNLAGAYGLSVSATMLIATILMLVLLRTRTSPAARLQFAAMLGIAAVETGYVLGNLGKIPHGGWFPLLYGLVVFGVMRTWQSGRRTVADALSREERSVPAFLADIESKKPVRVDRTAVFLSSNPNSIPRTLVRNLRINGILHERTILLTITTDRVPRVLSGARMKTAELAPGLYRVHAHVGFMEMPNVPKLLRDAERQGLEFRTGEAIYFLGRDDIVAGGPRGMSPWRKKIFIFLANNAQFAGAHFGIPPERIMEVGGQVQI
jgi:KUP system potassium uptake protein